MMMRMLEAGGMPLIADNVRIADEDNPRGYYEFEPAKQTRHDASWLRAAPGRAVKMVYRLLYDLPQDYAYRVVFMRRNLEEVLASQRTMLERQGNTDTSPHRQPVDDEQMAMLFAGELEKFERWVARQPNFSVHEANYNDLLGNPRRQAKRVNRFLGKRLDARAMARVVDASLYRNRS